MWRPGFPLLTPCQNPRCLTVVPASLGQDDGSGSSHPSAQSHHYLFWLEGSQTDSVSAVWDRATPEAVDKVGGDVTVHCMR